MRYTPATQTALVALLIGTASGVSALENDTSAEASTVGDASQVTELSVINVAMERIQVIGKYADRASIVGSATRLSAEDLAKFNYSDVNRTLRLVPGVNIQEEDGYGLRPNIGLRGSGVERSSKITLMEDGVLIAPAPYAAPSAYYFPTSARMEAVEVRNGSAAIKFGPRTVGGAINFVSRSIPDEFGAFVDVRYGTDSLRTLHTSIGGSTENFGGLIEVYDSNNDGFKNLPDGGDTGYDVEDYLGKFRINTSPDADIQQSLEFKISKTDGDSNETYLGLTQADFDEDPYQRYAASALDNIDTEHEQIQLTYNVDFGDVQLVTTAYRNEFSRDWFKFQDMRNATDTGNIKGNAVLEGGDATAIELSWLKGLADSIDGAIRIRHNARAYVSKGVQSLIAIPFTTGGVGHDLELSLRYHKDYEDRLQFDERYTVVSGALEFASAGTPGSAGNRIVSAEAWAFFAQDTITYGDWTFVPGVRFESIDLDRSDWAGDDAARSGSENVRDTVHVNTFVPGLGVSYKIDDSLLLTGGVFKGFNPPGPGNVDAEEETSLNIEFGAVYDAGHFNFESMVFYSDYANILGTCTNSVACNGAEIGDQFNGGEATIWGLEFLAGYTAELGGDWQVPFYINYTYTDAEFSTSFEDSFWGDVTEGDAFPYLSKHQFTASIGAVNDDISVYLQANYVSASRTDAGTGSIPLEEKIDGRIVLDASVRYQVFEGYSVYVTVDNLLDNEYSVARRPIGLRPGKPRSVLAGMKINF
ncbi:MAG: TonB-dependent receptor [Kordiimonadaceae bacterium]|nr:TonB-dependent receptor [Kordiimonadaceae bacterium]